jgi:hypothetical protein
MANSALLIAMFISVIWSPEGPGSRVTDNYPLGGFSSVEACRDAEASVKTQVSQMYPPNALMIARCVSAAK